MKVKYFFLHQQAHTNELSLKCLVDTAAKLQAPKNIINSHIFQSGKIILKMPRKRGVEKQFSEDTEKTKLDTFTQYFKMCCRAIQIMHTASKRLIKTESRGNYLQTENNFCQVVILYKQYYKPTFCVLASRVCL